LQRLEIADQVGQLSLRECTPGFMADGLRSQRASSGGVFGATPPASCRRLAKCVRSGPTRARAGVPPIAWQLAHIFDSKIRRPRAAASVAGAGASARWCASHASNAACGWATTRNRIQACPAPQYSAHSPW